MSTTNAVTPLAALLGHDHAARFVAQHWPDRIFHAHVDPSAWPEFLRLPAWSDPHEIDAFYRGPIDVTRGAIGQYKVSGASVSGWVTDLGLAARLSELERTLPGAGPWVAALGRELGVPAGSGRLNAFVNPPGVGLGVHCDPVEHLLIHVAGEKTIRLHANPAGPHVTASHAIAFTPSSREGVQYPEGLPAWSSLGDRGETVLLRPGSVLFMPRGTYHETLGGDAGVSASLVVQFELPNLADLTLAYLHEYLLQHPRWRRPAAGAWGDDPAVADRLRGELEALLGELAPRLSQLTVDRIFATHRRTLTSNVSTPGSRPSALRPDDRFVRNPSVQVALDPEGVIRLTRNLGRGRSARLALGPRAAAVVDALAAIPRPLTFAEVVDRFEDWEPESLAEIVAFLVRRDVLVPLVPEPWNRPYEDERGPDETTFSTRV